MYSLLEIVYNGLPSYFVEGGTRGVAENKNTFLRLLRLNG